MNKISTLKLCDRRKGSLLLEVVVASALLGVCIIALGKLGGTASKLQQQSMNDLTVRMAIDNVLNQLQGLPKDEIDKSIESLEGDAKATCGCDVSIKATDVNIADQKGVRISIVGKSLDGHSITAVRWWRLNLPETADAREGENDEK